MTSHMTITYITITITTSYDTEKSIEKSKRIILYIILYYDSYIYMTHNI